MEQTKPTRKRAPSICVDVDVSLDEFDLDEVADYLRHNGYKVSGTTSSVNEDGPSNVLDPDDLDHVYTLSLCGQSEVAKQIALQLVGDAIGRPLH